MTWKLIVDGSPETARLVDTDTGAPVVLPAGHTAVVDLHIHQPEPTPVAVPPEVARDLAAFAAHGKTPPDCYAPYLPAKTPHRRHHATVRLVPDGHVFGKLTAVDVAVEVVGDGPPTVHHGLRIQG